MTEKTWFANSGDAVVVADIQDDNELRDTKQSNPDGVIISGFTPSKGSNTIVAISVGTIMIKGRIVTTSSQINHTVDDLTQSQVVYMYYDATQDVAPNYDCMITDNIPAASYTPPMSDGTNSYCVPIAYVTVNGGVIDEVIDISPRNKTWYIKETRPKKITSDIEGLRGALVIENTGSTDITTFTHKNFALKTIMDKDDGFAHIINGRLLFDTVNSYINVFYDSGNDFIIQDHNGSKNFFKLGYYDGSGDDTRVEFVSEVVTFTSDAIFNGDVTFNQDIEGEDISGQSFVYTEPKLTSVFFTAFDVPFQDNHITYDIDVYDSVDGSTMQTNDASGGFIMWKLHANYSYELYEDSGYVTDRNNVLKSAIFYATGGALQIIEIDPSTGKHSSTIFNNSTPDNVHTINYTLDPTMVYVVRWSDSGDATTLKGIELVIEENYV